MPFTAETFKPLLGMSTSDTPRIFGYRTNDLADATADQIESAGYFNSLADEFNEGDQIFTHADADGASVTLIYFVRSIISGVVTVQRCGA